MKTTTFTKTRILSLCALGVIFVVLALFPTINQGYWVTLLTDMLRYAVLTVAWVIFSGPTGYMSLATAAFYGLGFYTAAIGNGPLPFAVVITPPAPSTMASGAHESQRINAEMLVEAPVFGSDHGPWEIRR